MALVYYLEVQMLTTIPNVDRVIILRDKVKDKTDAGLYIPNADKQSTNTGIIVVSGKRSELYEDIFPAGSRIIYSISRDAHEIDVDGETYLVLPVQDIIVQI